MSVVTSNNGEFFFHILQFRRHQERRHCLDLPFRSQLLQKPRNRVCGTVWFALLLPLCRPQFLILGHSYRGKPSAGQHGAVFVTENSKQALKIVASYDPRAVVDDNSCIETSTRDGVLSATKLDGTRQVCNTPYDTSVEIRLQDIA